MGLPAGSSRGAAGGGRESAEAPAPGAGLGVCRAGEPHYLSPWLGARRRGGGPDRPEAGRAGRPRRGPAAEGKMSALLEQKEQQERLREAAALGDIREVQKLVESGVDVNSQNEVNGW